ncbi:MAG: glycerol-3-phosphate 1-O-acyltransferase PlsY [Armatimonadetes bacterium]|nr:glycerol-3-phosphate 1-O-acyltransferase PlsY [Armatimonadota bacterium]
MAAGGLCVAVAYLLGGIPVGLLIARSKGVDLFQVGSGNIGATNVVRALGCKWGIVTWLGDTVKGLLAVLIAKAAGQPEAVWAACGAAAVTGHCWSPYLRLRGGRGVATSFGALIAVDWRVGLGAFAVWAIFVALTRIVSLASLAAAASLIPWALLWHDTGPMLLLTGYLTCIGFMRHKPNLERLLRGEERPIGQKNRGNGSEGGQGQTQEQRP